MVSLIIRVRLSWLEMLNTVWQTQRGRGGGGEERRVQPSEDMGADLGSLRNRLLVDRCD